MAADGEESVNGTPPPTPKKTLAIKLLDQAHLLTVIVLELFQENDPQVHHSGMVAQSVWQVVSLPENIYKSSSASYHFFLSSTIMRRLTHLLHQHMEQKKPVSSLIWHT